MTSRETGLLALILAGAWGVRLLGVSRGLPYLHEWDEPTVLSYVIGMLQRGDLYPNAFVYPSVYYYLLLPVMYLHYFYLHAHGVLSSPWDIQLYHPQAATGAYWWYLSAPSFYLWGRILTTLMGTATVYLVYRIGKTVYGAPVGLLAAVLLAVAPGAVYFSDTVRVDIPMTFFATLTVLLGLNVLRRGILRDYILAGFFAGVAISTKTNAIVIVLTLAAAHVLNAHRKRLVDLSLALMGLCVLVGFAVGTPYVLIRSKLVLTQIRDQALAYGGIPSLTLMKTILPRYLDYFIHRSQGDEWFVIPHAAFGLLPAISAVAGAIVGFRLAPRLHLYLLGFPLTYLIFMSGQKLTTLRNMMAVLPFAALFAAVGSVWIWEQLRARWPSARRVNWQGGLAGLGIVVLLAAPARDSATLAWTMGHRPDTRTAAVDWLRQHVPPGARVSFEEDLRWFIPDLERLPFTLLYATRDANAVWYLQQHVDFAVVGDRSPLRSLPPVATFVRPRYVYTGDSWPQDSYPVIDPLLFVVRPKIKEINATFPVEVSAGDMIPEPVTTDAVGVFSEIVHLPDQRFDPGSYTLTLTGAWPWLWASPTHQLYVEVIVGQLNVAGITVGGSEPLKFTTQPFRIGQTQTLPIQVKIMLRTQHRSAQSGGGGSALRPSPTACAIVHDAPSLNVQQMTLEAWVYLEAMNEVPGMRSHPGLESEGPILSKRDNDGYYLRLSGDTNNKIWADLSVAGKYAVGRAGFVPFRKWTHIAATYDGHAAQMYLNGSPAIQDSGRTPRYEGMVHSAGAPLAIGCRDPEASNQVSFIGLITGVRVWNRVLRPEEIRDESSIRQLPDKSPGLVGSWSFQSVAGTQIPDLSGSGNAISNGAALKRVPIEGGTPALPAWTSGQLGLLRTVEIRRVNP